MKIEELLALTVKRGASDLHLSVGIPPYLRIDGELVSTDLPHLTPENCKELSYSLLDEEQRSKFEKYKSGAD